MESILLFASAVSVITIMSVELVKHTTHLSNRYLPIVSVVIGVIVGVLALLIPELTGDISVGAHILAGAISGLSASGLYDLTTKTTKVEE